MGVGLCVFEDFGVVFVYSCLSITVWMVPVWDGEGVTDIGRSFP